MKKSKKPKIVYVCWDDASYQSDWQHTNEIETECRLETVGFLLKETKKHLSVAGERYGSRGKHRQISHIPKSIIVERRDLS